ncbi:acyltransferase family protein [Sporosarcina ureilytica]|uniref:Acyltransferase n=1 Tax=Sporosarcina ureilytica TaxID=298596 RepID=A0A1D8JJ97_9BACL|nr:acyltransferase family protein [Sporosarcina ureilytica]AOV08760.1 hypothetical protein BI350_15225 [Sporosarcina ureilytica]
MNQIPRKRYRLEIEGVRAIAALLVAIYHIWLNRVSGGVDVFFTISGFLITTSLLSSYQKEGKLKPFSYIIRLLKRLVPSAWFIALTTFILSIFLAPAYTRPQYFSELVASLFYFENWRLAFDAVDYLAQNNEASPFQHYWALAIQFQFYIIWLVLFSVAMGIKKLIPSLTYKKVVLTLFGLVFIFSISYSIFLTDANQPFAYYHTLTRVWEFSLGGILALVIHRVTFPKVIAWFTGWIGLVALLLVGLVLQVSTVFPGYAALWPTGAAILILLAGNQSTRFSAYKILASKPLVSFGKVSYAFYLWHWPILVLFLKYFERGTVTIKAGIAMIVLSIALAYFTIYVIETPLRTMRTTTKQTALYLAALSIVVGGSLWFYYGKTIPKQMLVSTYGDNLGATAHQVEKTPFYYDEETLTPTIEQSLFDRSSIYEDKCIQINNRTDVIECEYGEVEDYEYTIALAGGSHAAHWKPMLDEFGNENQVRIKTMLKGNCRFSTEDTTDTPDCEDWFENVVQALKQDPPDLIFTHGDISSNEWKDEIPNGFKEAWAIFEKEHIPMFLVRDTPRHDFMIPYCLNDAEGDLIENCRTPRNDAISPVNLLENTTDLPKSAHVFDATDYFCDDEYCYPIIGNIIAYFDNNHITASISRTFMPILENDLKEALINSERLKKLRDPK